MGNNSLLYHGCYGFNPDEYLNQVLFRLWSTCLQCDSTSSTSWAGWSIDLFLVTMANKISSLSHQPASASLSLNISINAAEPNHNGYFNP